MGFTDDVKNYKAPIGGECSVGLWRASQTPDLVKEFDAVMADSSVTGKAIWLAMKSRGFAHTAQTVTRHRGGECKCPSPTM